MSEARRFPAPPGPDLEEAPLGAGLDWSDPDSPLERLYLRTSHVVAAALLGLIFLFFSHVPLWHTDIWGHLKFGQWMVAHGRLPRCEPFCRLPEQPGESLHAYWLCQVGLYLLYHAGEWLAGGDGVRQMEGGVAILRATLAAVLLLRCWLLLAAFRRLSGSLPVACVSLLALVLVSVGHITVFRPQVFGELFFAGILLALSRRVLSRPALVVVPALLILWANVHGSYPAGLILLAACGVGQAVRACWLQGSWRPWKALGDVQVRRLLLTLLLSVAGIALLNPHGPWIYGNTILMGRNLNVRDMEEWLPLSWSHAQALVCIHAATLVLLAVAPVLSRRWYTPAQLLVLLAFAAAPFCHVRMMVWWYMVAAWLLLPHWRGIHARWLQDWPTPPALPSLRRTVLAVLTLAVFLCWSSPAQWVLSGQPTDLEHAVFKGTPWRVAAQLHGLGGVANPLPALGDALAQGYPEGQFTGGVFASETEGDYLTWALVPETPVFLYTHVHLFPVSRWQQCVIVKYGLPGWREILDGYQANLVVIEAEMYPQLCGLLREDADWQVLVDETGDTTKRDSRARLFVALRRQPLQR